MRFVLLKGVLDVNIGVCPVEVDVLGPYYDLSRDNVH